MGAGANCRVLHSSETAALLQVPGSSLCACSTAADVPEQGGEIRSILGMSDGQIVRSAMAIITPCRTRIFVGLLFLYA